MNISERSEVEIIIIQTHQLAPTGDPLVDEDAAAQAYHTMKQNPGESTNKYRVRMEDAIKVMERLGIDLPTPQQQAMRYLKSLDRAKHGHMLADLKNKALSNPDNTYPVDLCAMCDLATNQSNNSVGVRNDIPASGVVFNKRR